ncbi:MAG: SdrD B-like domain-containing protein [Pirellulaceae bacterium]
MTKHGVQGVSGSRINGVTIELKQLNAQQIPTVVQTAITQTIDLNGDGLTTPNEIGLYSFENLSPGTYFVEEVRPSGQLQTTINPPPIAIVAGEVYVGQLDQSPLPAGDPRLIFEKCLAFGNRPTSSYGFKFHDVNRDGLFQPTEGVMVGVQFTITTINNMPVTNAFGELLTATTTDANGFFGFENLLPGTYVVTEVLPPSMQSTTGPLARTFVLNRHGRLGDR